MRSVLCSFILATRDLAPSRAALHVELIALRHQLALLNRNRPTRVRLRLSDRLLWVWLSQRWSEWRSPLVIVTPETVIAWHRRGLRLFWTWKSRRPMGRPQVSADIRTLIRKIKMSDTNPRWGAPRIHGELLKLGIDVCQASVAQYMITIDSRHRRRGARSWRITSGRSSPPTCSSCRP